jgi:hypothetical protein
LITSLWDSKSRLKLIDLIPGLATALNAATSPYLPKITSMLLDSLEQNILINPDLSVRILSALAEFSSSEWNFLFFCEISPKL